MMIGIGTPSSHSKIPRPIFLSSEPAARVSAERNIGERELIAFDELPARQLGIGNPPYHGFGVGILLDRDHVTLADIALGAYARRWFGVEGVSKPRLPNLERWFAQFSARPGFQKFIAPPMS